MKAVILVPFRDDGAERTRNWGIARQYWARLGLPIVEGDNSGRAFERARARNVAAARAGEWDVALFADADIVLGSQEQAEAALLRSYVTGAYTVAYSSLRYVTEEITKLWEHNVGGISPAWDEEVGLTWECCFAVRRDHFDEVGGFDERFKGYGGQVAAFFYAYATFAGRERIDGIAYHLAHPLVDRSKDQHFEDNKKLAEKYKGAVDNPRQMRSVLNERMAQL